MDTSQTKLPVLVQMGYMNKGFVCDANSLEILHDVLDYSDVDNAFVHRMKAIGYHSYLVAVRQDHVDRAYDNGYRGPQDEAVDGYIDLLAKMKVKTIRLLGDTGQVR